jgi:class 3 adenylate cyclase
MYTYRRLLRHRPRPNEVKASGWEPNREVGLPAGQTMRRTLTVILASDVAGYSRLVADNEEDTVHRFQQAAIAFADQVGKHHGRGR